MPLNTAALSLASLHPPGHPLTAAVLRDAFDISGRVRRHIIGVWGRGQLYAFPKYESEGCVLWPCIWQIDGSFFLRRNNCDSDHRPRYFLEFFVVLQIDSSTIIIQNRVTAPHFDGIIREFRGEFLLHAACFIFLSCLVAEQLPIEALHLLTDTLYYHDDWLKQGRTGVNITARSFRLEQCFSNGGTPTTGDKRTVA